MRDTLRFGLVVLVFVLTLAGLNALPQFLGGEPRGIVRYRRIDQVEVRYGVRLWQPRIATSDAGRRDAAADAKTGREEPRVSRSTWIWPPARVRVAVGTPDWAQFILGRPGSAGVIVCQSLQEAPAGAVPPVVFLAPGEVLQTSGVAISGRAARVKRVLLGDGTIAHELWWREAGRSVILRLRGSLEDLMQAANVAFGNAS